MHLCLNMLASRVWKKIVLKVIVIISPFILGHFPSLAMKWISSLILYTGLFLFLNALCQCCFLQLGALYANIRHDPWSDYSWQKSEHSKHQWTWGFLGPKKHPDWLKINFNVTDIITVQDYNKKKLMWMEVHIYSVQAKSQAGNISVKHVMVT